MSNLTTKANGAKTVTPSKETEANAKSAILKNESILPKLETTAEKRLKNLDNFQSICKKFNFLKLKSDELSAYLVGRDGLKETLIIENTDGQTFEISNSLIIIKILELASNELLTLLEKAEKEVINFKI